MAKDYPRHYEHLQSLLGRLGHEIPETMSGFGALHDNAVADGELPAATKELIALGIAIAVRCDGCVAYHVHDAMAAGAVPRSLKPSLSVLSAQSSLRTCH